MQIINNSSEIILRFPEFIDETSDFSEILVPSGTKHLVLDLERVKVLNSSGLRSWVMWIRKLNNSVQLTFRNCPKNVVHQMNILDGFVPMGATIDSFYVPFHCDSCGHEEQYLARKGIDFTMGTADTKEGHVIPEQIDCPSCGAQMDQDIVPDIFFKFLKYRA